MTSRNAEKQLIPISLQALPRRRTFAHVDVEAKPSNVVAHKLGQATESTYVGWRTLLELVDGFRANRFVKLVKSRDWSIHLEYTSLLVILNLISLVFITVELTTETKPIAKISAVHELENEVSSASNLEKSHLSPRHFFDVISSRPLFDPSRRKIPNPPPEIEIEDITIELLGTFLSGTRRMALVRLGTQEHAIWVRERDYISSWIIETILAERLRLRRVDEVRIIDLWPKISLLSVTHLER